MKKIFICLFILILLVTGCTKKPDPVDPVPEDKGITVSELWTRLALEKEHVWNANDINIVFTKEGAHSMDEKTIMEYANKAIDAFKGDKNLLKGFSLNPADIIKKIIGAKFSHF